MENCLGIYRDEELDVKLKIKNQMSEIVKEKYGWKIRKLKK